MSPAAPPSVSVSREGDAAVVRLFGAFRLRDGLPPTGDVLRALDASPHPHRLRVESDPADGWDTSLVAFLARVHDACAERQVALDTSGVPEGARRLLGLARADGVLAGNGVGEGSAEPRLAESIAAWAKAWRRTLGGRVASPGLEALRPEPFAEVVGRWAIGWSRSLDERVGFLGSSAIAVARTLTLQNRKLPTRLVFQLQKAGVETLPIVALMAFAIGGVLALIASGQLQKFGATPLVAKIVSIAVLREMGALMVGIAIAGRLGSAIAAEFATMVANKETDVLRVVGIDPFDYLVAPRVLALAVAGPLLVVYANALGLAGSLFVGVAFAGLPAHEYIDRTRDVIGYKHTLAGLIKGLAFGVATAMVASYHGLRSGRSAGAVGDAVRRAVVGSVLGVVLFDVAITLLFKWVRL